MWTESEELGFSYQSFTEAVALGLRAVHRRHPGSSAPPRRRRCSRCPSSRPETVQEHVDLFLRDAREHLSFDPLTCYRMRRRVRDRITAAADGRRRDVAESVGHGASEAAYVPPRVPLDLT